MDPAFSSDADENPVLREDERGVPRSLRLLAALVEAESRRYAAAASRPAKSELVRAFRGGAGKIAAAGPAESELVRSFHEPDVLQELANGNRPGLGATAATPSVSVAEFLERIHRFIQLEDVRHVVQIQGTCYVLAGIYLARFFRSPAARESGILVEPSTAHRLVSAALFVGAKFGADNTLPKRWTVVFEISSDCAIRAREMAALERRFLRAVDYRLFVDGDCFDWFCRVLEKGPPAEGGTCRVGKRTAAGEEEDGDERRRVRPRLLPPLAVVSI